MRFAGDGDDDDDDDAQKKAFLFPILETTTNFYDRQPPLEGKINP